MTALLLSHARTAAPLMTETLASVAGAGAALAGVSLVAALAFFVYTRRFRGTDNATAALSRVPGVKPSVDSGREGTDSRPHRVNLGL